MIIEALAFVKITRLKKVGSSEWWWANSTFLFTFPLFFLHFGLRIPVIGPREGGRVDLVFFFVHASFNIFGKKKFVV